MSDQKTKSGRKRQVVQLPVSNLRECAACHEDRPIVSHGLCNRCHLRQKRGNDRLLFTPASAVTPQTGYEQLAALHKIMNKCKVSGEAKRVMLTAFLPFSALSQIEQAAHMEGLRNADTAADEGWAVHKGSSIAPDDSVNREPETE
jgi:hypothetical protein